MRRGFLGGGAGEAERRKAALELSLESAERVGWMPGSGARRPANLVVLLHGHGGSARDFAAYARRSALPGTCAVALRGPLRVDGGDSGWFEEPRDFDRAADAVLRALATLRRAEGWPARRVHLVGFSDGGAVALAAAARLGGDGTLGGVAAVAAALPRESLKSADSVRPLAAGTKAPPVLLLHGDADDVVRREDVERTASALTTAGFSDLELRSLAGKRHTFVSSEADQRALMHFWSRTLAPEGLPDDATPVRASDTPGELVVEEG